MKKLFKRSGFLIKSLALGLFLMIASATSSFAQYIQIEVAFDPSAPSLSPYTMQMKAYADAACTIPTTYYGYVSHRTVTYYGCDPTPHYVNHGYTIDEFNSAHLLYFGLYTNTRWDDYCGGHVDDLIDAFYSIYTVPGWTSYNIATEPVIFL